MVIRAAASAESSAPMLEVMIGRGVGQKKGYGRSLRAQVKGRQEPGRGYPKK